MQSRRLFPALALASACAAIAVVATLVGTTAAPSAPTVPTPDTQSDAPKATAAESGAATRERVEAELAVRIDRDPASWLAAFPAEQRAAIREYADRPKVALVLVEVRGFSRDRRQERLEQITATVASDVPELGYEAGRSLQAWSHGQSPFEPAGPDLLHVGERRVVLVEHVLWKTFFHCVSAPVSSDADPAPASGAPELLASLPLTARRLVRQGGQYSVVIARASRWKHPDETVARAAELASSTVLRLELVRTLFSHRPGWKPDTTHEVWVSPRRASAEVPTVDVARLPGPDTAALSLVEHDALKPRLLYVGDVR